MSIVLFGATGDLGRDAASSADGCRLLVMTLSGRYDRVNRN